MMQNAATTNVDPAAAGRPAWKTVLDLVNPVRHYTALREVVSLLFARRELVGEMARRDMGSAHAGHSFGTKWIYIHPIMIALVFFVIFGFVLGTRMILPTDFPGGYSAYILIGLIPWLMIQAALIRSTSALSSNGNLVKQVVFPIEVLPAASVMAAIIPYIPALVLVVLYSFYSTGGVLAMIVMLPLVVVMHLALSVGIGYALAGLTVFIRDLRELVNVFCLVAMYITPAVYVEDWVPGLLKPLLYFNPFSYLIWVYQDTLFYGEFRHPEAWIAVAVMSVLALSGGYRLFRRLKPFYGNVL